MGNENFFYHNGSDFNNLEKIKIKPYKEIKKTKEDLKLMKAILERDKIFKKFEDISSEISEFMNKNEIFIYDESGNQEIDLSKKLEKNILDNLEEKYKKLYKIYIKNIEKNIGITKEEKDFFKKNLFSIKWLLTNLRKDKNNIKTFEFNF